MEMKRMWMVLGLMLVIIVLSKSKCSNGCLDHERDALLQLRTVFGSPSSLLDWVEDSDHSSSDCCKWGPVVCDDTTKNVIELHLYDMKTWGLEKWYLNLTLFLPFEKLRTLLLSSNSLEGIVTDEGFDSVPKLTNLEYLDLSNNYFNNNTMSFLKAIPSLKILDLSYNNLAGTLHNQDTLHWIKEFVIPQGLCELRHLQVLDISYNHLGTLPSCLANLTSLRALDLSNNQFTGDVTESPITSLMSIEDLCLSNNHFKIPISFRPLYNHSKLKILEAEDILIYDDDLDPQYLFPNFQLKAIMLSCHGHVRAFPKFLYRQTDLEVLYIKDVHFEGEFPNYLLENNTQLKQLFLGNNSLSGILDFSNRSYSHLEFLDISNNLFYGEIPSHLGMSFPNLIFLKMSSNQFDGHIPSSFGDMNLLKTLDLSNNKLIGKIPKQLATGCVALYTLTLSHNRLEGEIFAGDFNLTGLNELRMAGNNFSGMIPNILYSTSISVLDMSKNRLEGPIPVEFCQFKSLQALDLSENNISGSIPSCFSPPHIQVVRLSKNKLQGTFKHALNESSFIFLLDLSDNQLTGSVPSWLDRLPDLNFLLLNNNHLEGKIPTQLCQLKKLSLINLSHNYLYGNVPNCLRITSVEEQHDINVVKDPYKIPNAYTPSPSTALGPTIASGPSTATSPAIPFNMAEAPIQDVTIEHVEFPTKKMSYSYQGEILNMMSGIDLSCNNFFGEIPPQLGSLSSIHALNLSHNNFSRPIPSSFGNLKQVESLDLSDNLLNGEIPPELGGLFSLGVFIVANNNLSGEIPTMTQFTTFNESSFLGNPLLCGTPLPKRCNAIGPEQPGAQVDDDYEEEEDSSIDIECFYASFGATYLTVLLGLVVVLMINPYWRRWWFYHVEKWMTFSYYFVVDNLHKIIFP